MGGGFGGLYTALSAAEKCPELEITLVDKKENFVFLPLLYDLVTRTASERDVTPRYDYLLSKQSNLKFVQGTVTSADFVTRQLLVTTKDGDSSELSYDQLVLATGSQARLVVPGAAENAIPFYTAEDAGRLRAKLESALREAVSSGQEYVRVVVVGGGYSGVEIATSVADYLGKGKAVVTVVDRNDMILPSSPESTRSSALRALISYGVSVCTNTSVLEITTNSVVVENKAASSIFTIPADVVIYSAGSAPLQLSEASCFDKDRYGRVKVYRTMQTLSRPEVFALGDCAQVMGLECPSTAAVALQQASIASANIVCRAMMLHGNREEPKRYLLEKFSYVPLGELLILGKADGAMSTAGGDVSASGPFAALARRLVYSYRMPTIDQKINVFFGTAASMLSVLSSKNKPTN